MILRFETGPRLGHQKPMSQNKDVIESLQRQQAGALVLYLNYKKYHWLTFGPTFRDLHLLFEEHGNLLLASVDELAERALMVDGRPLADPAKYLAASPVKASEGEMTVRAMAEEAAAGHDKLISELHKDAELANKAGDIGTVDVYTRLVQTHQKQRWFLKEILRKDGGL